MAAEYTPMDCIRDSSRAEESGYADLQGYHFETVLFASQIGKNLRFHHDFKTIFLVLKPLQYSFKVEEIYRPGTI